MFLRFICINNNVVEYDVVKVNTLQDIFFKNVVQNNVVEGTVVEENNVQGNVVGNHRAAEDNVMDNVENAAANNGIADV